MMRSEQIRLWSETLLIFGFMCKNQVDDPQVQCCISTLYKMCCLKKKHFHIVNVPLPDADITKSGEAEAGLSNDAL